MNTQELVDNLLHQDRATLETVLHLVNRLLGSETEKKRLVETASLIRSEIKNKNVKKKITSKDVLRVIKQAGVAIRTGDVAVKLGFPSGHKGISNRMVHLFKNKAIKRTGRGLYTAV